jgi:hypothetical protein
MRIVQLHGLLPLPIVAASDRHNPLLRPEQALMDVVAKYDNPWFLFWHVDAVSGVEILSRLWRRDPESGPFGAVMYRGGAPYAGLSHRSQLDSLRALLPPDYCLRIDILDDSVGKLTSDLASRLQRFVSFLSGANTLIPWDALRAPDWPAGVVSLVIAARLISNGLWTAEIAREKLDTLALGSEVSSLQLKPPNDDTINTLLEWAVNACLSRAGRITFPCQLCNLRNRLCHTFSKMPSVYGGPFSIEQWACFQEWEESVDEQLTKVSQGLSLSDLREQSLAMTMTALRFRQLAETEVAAIRSLLAESQAAYCRQCADQRAANQSLLSLVEYCTRLNECRRSFDGAGYVREVNGAKRLLVALESDDNNCRVPM